MWRSPVLGAVLSLALASPALAAGPWKGEATDLAGRWQISKGELVYTDYLYDDYGADRDGAINPPAFRANLAPTNGDLRYPADSGARTGFNAADLRELRLAIRDGRLDVRVALQTMLAKDVTAAIVAIDTDGDATTGAARWPGNAGITTPGADRFILTWGTGAQVIDAQGNATDVPVDTDLGENTYDLGVPLGLLGDLQDDAKVYAGVGLAQGKGFTADGLWNVAFRGDDDWPRLTGYWGEHEQSQALARGDIGAFAAPLRPDLLRARGEDPFRLTPGFYDRIFKSKFDFGEGIDLKQGATGAEAIAGSARPMFKGRWQPYGLYVPPGYDRRKPAQLLLNGHSLDINHNEYRTVAPQQLKALGAARGSLIVTPLARGTDTWYLDAGLADVFEAWDDVRAHYAVDDERTSITGYSMGGYMTYRLGLLMPDAFARASVYVGPPAYYSTAPPAPRSTTREWEIAGNTQLLTENALNLPYEVVSGNADELVPITGVVDQVDRLLAGGGAVRFHRHAADDHLSFILRDTWGHTQQWLGDARVPRRPVRVRYRRYPAMDLPRYGLRFDHAYWVRDIEVGGDDGDGDQEANGLVDATTYGFGGTVPRPQRLADRADPAPVGLSPATITEQQVVDGDAITRRNGFAARFESVDSARFMLSDMGLRPDRPLTLTLRGKGRLTVRLAGTFRKGTVVRLEGRRIKATRKARELSFRPDLVSDARTVTVTPGRPPKRKRRRTRS